MADLSDTIEFFRYSFGIEADFSAYTVYAPTDADALIEIYRMEVPDHYDVQNDYARVRSRWTGAGAWFQDDRIVIKQEQWRDTIWLRTSGESGEEYWRGQEYITHEYTHIVQSQLSTPEGNLKAYIGSKRARAPRWLSEGHADWVAQAYEVAEGHLSQQRALAEALQSISHAPALELSLGQLAYDLGRAAVHMISEQSGADAVNEMFRLMNATPSGPGRRWQLTLSWESALMQAVGKSAAELYSDFDAWRRRGADEQTRAGHRIEGRLVKGAVQGRTTALDLDLVNIRVELFGPPELNRQTLSGFPPTTWTDEQGQFTFEGLPDGNYSISVYFGSCRIADSTQIEGENITNIELVVTPDTCVHQIQGQVVGAQGRLPVHGWEINAFGNGGWSRARTQQDGQFALVVPGSGAYQISLDIGGCKVSYRDGLESGIVVAGDDVDGIKFQVPSKMCTLRLQGSMFNADGSPRAGALVLISSEAGSSSTYTSSDGEYTLPVPGSAVYSLSVLIDGCRIYRGTGGPSKSHSSASLVRVSNADVTGIVFRLPEDPVSFCN